MDDLCVLSPSCKYKEHLPEESEGAAVGQASCREESPAGRKVDSLSRFIQSEASLQKEPLAVLSYRVFNPKKSKDRSSNKKPPSFL